MILNGLTRYFQPLNLSINKLFRDELKKMHIKYCIDQKDTKTRETQGDLLYMFQNIETKNPLHYVFNI